MKILIIYGHPRKESLGYALAGAYERGARAAKAEVKILRLADLKFDPIFWSNDQKLEPDLIKAQKLISWADHIVLEYPTWWASPPALVKGFFDRVMIPGFAYKYKSNGIPNRLLKGKSARIIVTMDGPKIYYWLIGSPGHKLVKYGIMFFCGISPTRFTTVDKVRFLSEDKKKIWLKKLEHQGNKLA